MIIQYVKTEQPAAFTSNGSSPPAKRLNAPTPPAKVPAATVKDVKPEK